MNNSNRSGTPGMFILDEANQRAVLFLRAKGRMPVDFQELREWLLEWSQYADQMSENLLKALREHSNICTCGTRVLAAETLEDKQ